MALNGTGVAIATLGGVLVYAGLTKQNPLSALRAVGSGHPAAVATTSGYQNTQSIAADQAVGSGVDSVANIVGTAVAAGNGLPQLVQAVEQFSGDRYSQAMRWQPGYSDCSSFVGKGFKSLGITPPGASVTTDYLAWSKLVKIPASLVQAGDLICNATHIVVATSNTDAIGQENPRRNVATGPISDLMAYTGAYVCLRYKG